MIEPITPITKQQQLYNNRHKPKQRNRTRITKKVRDEVLRRVEERFGYLSACERCGRSNSYSYEHCHLENASQLGEGNKPWNIVQLCGPSVNSNTCHNIVDYTTTGREWKRKKQQELKTYYGVQ